jgi:hypothetical protein
MQSGRAARDSGGSRLMSRAMNVTLTEAEVTTLCERSGVAISAMEPLPSGGCHLVTVTAEGAETMRRKLNKHLIAGRVPRFAFFRA